MNLQIAANHIIPAGLGLMPAKYDSPEARAMLLAIGLQESGFKYRMQISGPARSFFQFEQAGVNGVMTHHASREAAFDVCSTLGYPTSSIMVFSGMRENDLLAVCFARLLLYTLPQALPRRDEPNEAWKQYKAAWRPGKPRFDDWAGNYARAWDAVAKVLQA